jgi:hypothetical protein
MGCSHGSPLPGGLRPTGWTEPPCLLLITKYFPNIFYPKTQYLFRLQSANLAALTIYLSQLPDRGDVDAIAARDAVIGLARLEPDLDFLLLLRRQLVWLAWSLR